MALMIILEMHCGVSCEDDLQQRRTVLGTALFDAHSFCDISSSWCHGEIKGRTAAGNQNSVQILNVARPNCFFAICLIFADKLPLLMGLTSRAEQAVFSSSCRGQHCVTKSLRGNPTGNLKHSHIDANASHVRLPTDYILKQMCWHFTEQNE